MFQIAGQHLQRPKVRLITEENEYIELWFIQRDSYNRPISPTILLFQGGWQGHGRRTRIGMISEGEIRPFRSGSISPSIKAFLQAFSQDPARIALASAKKLSACSFCGKSLSDPESKQRGYGPVCADHFHLPWGEKTEAIVKKVQKIASTEDLSDLF